MAFKHQNTNVYLVPSDSVQHRQSFMMTACNLGVRMSEKVFALGIVAASRKALLSYYLATHMPVHCCGCLSL